MKARDNTFARYVFYTNKWTIEANLFSGWLVHNGRNKILGAAV